MKKLSINTLFSTLLLSSINLFASEQITPQDEPVAAPPAPESTRVLFLSCINQDYPQPLWDELHQANGDAILFIGDNVYADSGDPQILKEEWGRLEAQEGFQKVRSQAKAKDAPFTGTWDDHEFGLNDGGREFEGKHNAQTAFLDFFEVAQDSPRRKQEGVYHSLMMGEGDHSVQLIMLDTRFFRGPLNKNAWFRKYTQRYDANTDDMEQVMLGEKQWSWLEQELQKPAKIRIIASSVQFAADNHGFEGWWTLPKESQRMLELIKKTEANGIIFISGDRHLSELMKISQKESGVNYPIYDLTSSSFNTSKWNPLHADTKRQVQEPVFEDNFGAIDIFWQAQEPYLELKLIGENSHSWLSHTVKLKDLH